MKYIKKVGEKVHHRYCVDCKIDVPHEHGDENPSHKIYWLGLKLTEPKPQQFKYTRHYGVKNPKNLPGKVDYLPVMMAGGFKIFDQGQQGSCTANCGCGDKAYHEISQGDYPGPFSRAFLYYEERKLHGWENQDSGANMSDIGDVLGKEGVCLDKTMPYNDRDYTTAPSATTKSEALGWLDSPDQTRLSIPEIKPALADHGPVRFGWPVYQTFMNTGSDGFVPPTNSNDPLLGGHATLCVGYDDAMTHNGMTGFFKCINSWGTGFGANGVFYFAYDIYKNYDSKGGTDNWQQLDVVGPPPPPPPTCPPGEHWDSVQGKCVPDVPPGPSNCVVGNTTARLMNFLPRLLGRQGRFHYLVQKD